MSGRQRGLRKPTGPQRGGRLQARRPRLLVQGLGAPSKAPKTTSKAETPDDLGAVALRLRSGAVRTGREALVRRAALPPTPDFSSPRQCCTVSAAMSG